MFRSVSNTSYCDIEVSSSKYSIRLYLISAVNNISVNLHNILIFCRIREVEQTNMIPLRASDCCTLSVAKSANFPPVDARTSVNIDNIS